MIFKTNDLNPLIIFDNYGVQEEPINYTFFSCSAVNITKKDIPRNFYIEEILETPLTIGMSEGYKKPKVLSFVIKLNNNIKLTFTNNATANIYFKILCSNLKNQNIEEQYPELFL